MIFVAVAQVPKGRGSMAALRLVVMVRKAWSVGVMEVESLSIGLLRGGFEGEGVP